MSFAGEIIQYKENESDPVELSALVERGGIMDLGMGSQGSGVVATQLVIKVRQADLSAVNKHAGERACVC